MQSLIRMHDHIHTVEQVISIPFFALTSHALGAKRWIR